MDFFKKKPQTDEHGNPVHNTHGGNATATAATGHHQGKLHRTSSSSSSSSEDDGQGGRRKKGIKEKIKEKMPGKQKDQARPAAAATTTPVGGAHEKKGFVDKIKGKLPGHHQ